VWALDGGGGETMAEVTDRRVLAGHVAPFAVWIGAILLLQALESAGACPRWLYPWSYAAKSATEKISRNRHGLDADGNPISGAGVGEYTTTTTSDKEAKG
jgi:hypothetical protein